MDFSFEKTHSAYMLFYERCDPNEKDLLAETPNIELNQELADWIWHDNIQFLHDKHVFDTTYFNFMWLICSNIPPSVPESNEVVLSNVKLGNYDFVFCWDIKDFGGKGKENGRVWGEGVGNLPGGYSEVNQRLKFVQLPKKMRC